MGAAAAENSDATVFRALSSLNASVRMMITRGCVVSRCSEKTVYLTRKDWDIGTNKFAWKRHASCT